MHSDTENKNITLKRNQHHLTILPHIGGALHRWRVGEIDLLRPVSNPNLKAQKGEAIGAYPLFPYSNRIAGGEFSFAGESYKLTQNMAGCPHPLHGNGWENPWEILHQTASHAVLAFDHTPITEEEKCAWPFAYRAVLSYALREDGLEISLVLENRSDQEQPVGFGFHPFFAIDPESSLSFEAKNIWDMTEDGLPLQPHPFKKEILEKDAFQESAFDTLFSGFKGNITLTNPQSRHQITIEADPIFQHMVMFKEKNGSYVALEPVTHLTNAHNMPETAETGLHILKPKGETGTILGGIMRFGVKKL